MMQAAFGDNDRAFRRKRRKLLGGGKVNLKRFKAAVIDADDVRTACDSDFHFIGSVCFDKRVHAELAGLLQQIAQLRCF